MAVPRWVEALGWTTLVLGGLLLWAFPQQITQLRLQGTQRTVSSCDLQAGPCEVALSDGSGVVTVQLGPPPFTHATSVDVVVSLGPEQATAARVDLQSISMNMGLMMTDLTLVDGAWRGEIVLPVCTQRIMVWRTDWVLSHGADHQVVTLEFTTQGGAA